MSLILSNSTYAGELALPYIHAALLSGDTIAKGYVTLKEGVKYKAVLKKLSSGNLVQSWDCAFTDDTDLTLAESVLTVTDLKVNLEVCKSQFAKDWEAMSTGRGFANDVVPANFSDFLIGYAAANVAQNIEFNIWQGDFGGAGSYTAFDGLEKKIKAATTLETDWASMSASTVIANMQAVLALLPASLIGDPEVKVYVNRATAQFYKQAVAALGYAFEYNAFKEFNLQIDGYDIYVCPGISNGTVVVSRPDNLFVGVDANSDFAEVKVVDMSLTDASDNVRMAMKFRVGTAVGFGSDVAIGYID
jgi:hypothetical protein